MAAVRMIWVANIRKSRVQGVKPLSNLLSYITGGPEVSGSRPGKDQQLKMSL